MKKNNYFPLKRTADWGTSWQRLDPNLLEPQYREKAARATLSEMIELAHDAYLVSSDVNKQQQAEPFRKMHRKILEKNGMWAFTAMLYVPHTGIYIQDNPNVKNGLPILIEDELNDRIGQGDYNVRFVSHDKLQTGEMTPEELMKNDYVIALAGIEGARKLGEIARNYSSLPIIHGPEYSCVASLYCSNGKRLEINKFPPKKRGFNQPLAFTVVTDDLARVIQGKDTEIDQFAFEVIKSPKKDK